jgi:hypothetical protein
MGYPLKDKFPAWGFYGVPHCLFDSGAFAALSASAQSLLIFYYRVFNRKFSPRFTVAERVIELEIGMTPNTIGGARKQLESTGLIRCERASKKGAPYIYHLVNPETNEPYPAESNKPAIYEPSKRIAVAAPEETDSPAVSDRSEAQQSMATPTPIREIATHKSTAATQSATVQRVEGICYQHGNKSVWQRGDGSPVCGECHPPLHSQESILRNKPESTPQTTAHSADMTEHGLSLKF